MEKQAVIEVDNLVKAYGGRAVLKGISFQVLEGEVFGLLGENGAGKTTTLEIIEGLRRATSGATRVLGLDSVKDINSIKERIGVQLQASAYFEHLTLEEILRLFGTFYHTARDPQELLSMVDLEDRGNMRVGQLSGGQKQRFSIVAALVNNPDIIFLDEPTTGLDPIARLNLWDLVREIEAQGKTVILTSHYLEEAEALCSRVGIIKQGEILAVDSPANLILRQENPIRMEFLPAKQLSSEFREKLQGMGALKLSEERASEYVLFLRDIKTLRQALHQLDDIELERLAVSTANLEEVFINLTGGRISQEEA